VSVFVKLVGNKIKVLRKSKGLTQAELGAKADLLQPFIAAVEKGDRNISLDTLDKLLRALEVTPGQFLNLDDLDIKSSKDKQAILEIHNSLLLKRNLDEIKLIHRITTDILNTIEKKVRA
jgi:transcriptional regulator with XRE-family HTH domain